MHLLEALDKRCFGRRGLCTRPGGGTHENCLGKVARRAAIFSDQMCETILIGFSAQMKADRRLRENEFGVQVVELDGQEEIDMFKRGHIVSELVSPPLTDDDRRRGVRTD